MHATDMIAKLAALIAKYGDQVVTIEDGREFDVVPCATDGQTPSDGNPCAEFYLRTN